MTGDELIKLQRRLGISNSELAKLTGRTCVSVWRWRQGRVAVPVYVQRILELRTVERLGIAGASDAWDCKT